MKLPLRKSYLRLLIIMILVSLITTGLCIFIIYNVVYNEKQGYLKELCTNQLNVIKSIYRETNDEKTILAILRDQNKNHSVLGYTGEYIIAVLKNDSIDFLLDLRRTGYSNISPIPLTSDVGIPIKYALSNKTGFITGMDYSDIKVMAYCAFIPELNWGLVAKMDISEVNHPFYKAGIYAIVASLILVLMGILAFRKTFDPIIERIIEEENRYRNLYDYSAIPIWEADFSRIKMYFDKLKESGVKDFSAYFENNKNEIRHLTSLAEIKDVNQKSVTIFEVNNKDEIISNLLSYFNEDSLNVFRNELVGFGEGRTHFETELPVRTLDGEIKTLLFNMSVTPGHENDLKEVLISFIDITKRKKAEDLLLENEARLKRSQEIAHLGSWELDLVSNQLTCSDEVYKIFGFQPEEFVTSYRAFQEAIHPDDRNLLDEAFNSSVNDRTEGFELEHRITRKYTNELRYVYEKCFHLRDTTGKIIKSVGMIQDITERKAIEVALKDSEQKLKYHFENSPLAVVEWDTDFYITQWSKEAEHIFGWKSEDVIGKRIDTLNIIYEEDIPIVNRTMERLTSGDEKTVVSTNRNITKSGDIIQCIWYNSVLLDERGQMASTMSLVEDITERKKAEDALRRSEENLLSFLDATQESLYMFDKSGKIMAANLTAAKRFKLSRSEMIGHNLSEFLPENLAVTRMSYLTEVVNTGKPVQFEDIRENIAFEHNFFPLSRDGKIIGVVSFSRDITERKKAEEAIRQSDEKFRAIALNTPDHIIIQDADLRYITVINPQLGLTENDMIGKTDFDILIKSEALKLTEIKRNVIQSGNPEHLTIPITARDGSTHIFEGSYIPKRDSKGVTNGIIGYFRNVTARYKMEEDLKKSEAQLRELNATKDKFFNIVAHDLKNPFTSLLGSTELLYDSIHLMDSKKIIKLAQILNDSAKSGYAILLNLLDWSRSQTGLIQLNPESINLKNLIDENISDLKLYSTNKEIHLFSEVKEDMLIFADKNVLNTVLRNLLSNGIKFTHKGGQVCVSASVTANEVIISVKDNGIGISEENIKNMFRIDTKFQLPGTENEQGTGLGLKLCNELVEKHGGKMFVESIENFGSEFKLSIPVINDRTGNS